MANLNSLPTELLQEVFTWCLTQPLDDFMEFKQSNPWWRCPGSTGGRESTTILLVCKRWNDVGTPLKYRQVCLACDRSPTHAAHIASVLVRKPYLGQAIRHLKILTISPQQFAPLYEIVKLAPNIEALYIQLDCLPAAGTAVDFFSRIVGAMGPSRLYLVDTDTHSGIIPIGFSPFYPALISAMKMWTALRFVHLFDYFYFIPQPLAEALEYSSELQELSVATTNIPNYWATGTLDMVTRNRKLNTITCRGAVKDLNGRLQRAGISQEIVNKLSMVPVSHGLLNARTCNEHVVDSRLSWAAGLFDDVKNLPLVWT